MLPKMGDGDNEKQTEVKNGSQTVNVNIDVGKVPVMYTDNVFMTSNEDGVVLDFAQRVGSTKQVQVVARVGMSREHAKKFVEVLSKNLLINKAQSQTGPKIIN